MLPKHVEHGTEALGRVLEARSPRASATPRSGKCANHLYRWSHPLQTFFSSIFEKSDDYMSSVSHRPPYLLQQVSPARGPPPEAAGGEILEICAQILSEYHLKK